MQIGIVGLGRMGANMVERLRRGGHEVIGYDRDPAVSEVASLDELVGKLAPPRTVWTSLERVRGYVEDSGEGRLDHPRCHRGRRGRPGHRIRPLCPLRLPPGGLLGHEAHRRPPRRVRRPRREAGILWKTFSDSLSYMSGPFDDPDCLGPLGEHLERLDATQGTEGRRLYYCATPPSAFPVIVRRHRDAVDHVQITVAEAVGMECRGAYYEEAGALRDMAQNHLLQVLSFLAMEPPGALDPEAIRDEKVKLLRALRRSLRSL